MTPAVRELLRRATTETGTARDELILQIAMLLEMNTVPDTTTDLYIDIIPFHLRSVALEEAEQYEIASCLKAFLLSSKRRSSTFWALSKADPRAGLPVLLEVMTTEQVTLDWDEAWQALCALAKLLVLDERGQLDPSLAPLLRRASPVPFLNHVLATDSPRLVREAKAIMGKLNQAWGRDGADVVGAESSGALARRATVTKSPIAFHRREVLVGFNRSSYFSLVFARTIYESAGEYHDRVFAMKSSLSYERGAEEAPIRDTRYRPTNGSQTVEERSSGVDFGVYLATQDVHHAFLLQRPAEYFGFDNEGIFIKASGQSTKRAVVVPLSAVRRLFPEAGKDTVVIDAYVERDWYFVLLQEGVASWDTDALQRIVPVQRTVVEKAVSSLAG